MPGLVFVLLVSVFSVCERGVQQAAAGQLNNELVNTAMDGT